MAERALARKSQLFLHSILPVVDTHEEVVKKKFKRGKFVLTFAGLIKIIALVSLIKIFKILSTNKIKMFFSVIVINCIRFILGNT